MDSDTGSGSGSGMDSDTGSDTGSDGDPHIHVESKVTRGDAAVRDMVASAFGLAGDLPSRVTTGCGQRVAYAMTSPWPSKVTCLACREHAHREHLRLADFVERLGGAPGSPVGAEQARLAARRHREFAERFAGGKP